MPSPLSAPASPPFFHTSSDCFFCLAWRICQWGASRYNGITQDKRLRALPITGAGVLFCAGWDLPALTQAPDARPRGEQALFDLLEALGALPQPALAVVDGLAQDARLALALACDLVLAAPEARCAQGAADGLPDSRCAQLISELLGRRRAAQLALLPRSLSAQEAPGWGLINRVVPR